MTSPEFFTVTADFAALVEDASTDPDYDPQVAPVQGTVTFTPVVESGDIILATQMSPRPTGLVPAAITAIVDSDGRLKLRTATDEGGSGFTFAPVRLMADTALLELDSPLYYSVSFSGMTFNGRPARITGFTFQAPNADVEVNLIEVARAPGVPADGVTKIAPTGVRYDLDGDPSMIFTFGGVDIPEPLPLSEITGPQGPGATIAVGTVSTGSPGTSVVFTNTGTSGAAVFDVTIPRGDKGDTGDAATIAVGTVSTGSPGTDAAVVNSGSSGAAVFDFTIPRGDPGATNTAPDTHAASEKTTPVDADEVPLVDSAASWGLKKLTWANLKAAVGSWYDTAARTLTNKTLTSPTVNNPILNTPVFKAAGGEAFCYVDGPNATTGFRLYTEGTGSVVLKSGGDSTTAVFTPVANGVNYIQTVAGTAGAAPYITATGSDASVSLNLTTKGSGTVQVNGVPVVTTSGTQALTNKTISGASNTVTNLPASATPEAARQVRQHNTVLGDWYKVLTLNATAVPYFRFSGIYAVSTFAYGSVVFSVSMGTLGADQVSGTVEILSAGTNTVIADNAFKIVNNGYGQPFELWVKASGGGSILRYYVLSALGYENVTYDTSNTGQSAEPTGSVLNVYSSGVTARGVPVVTTTGAQTLSGKTLQDPTLSGFFQGNIGFTGADTGINLNSKGFLAGVTNAGNYSPLATANCVILRADAGDVMLSASGTGDIKFLTQDASVERMKIANDGTVTVGGVPVVTTTGAQTLTNKTLTTPTVSGTLNQTSTSAATHYIDSTVANQRSEVVFNEDSGDIRGWLQYRHSANGQIPNTMRLQTNTGTDADIVVGTNGSSDIFIAGGQNGITRGNIGIKNVNPTSALDVGGEIRQSGVPVVTTTGAQTLTNKTLTSPVISSPTGLVKADVGLGNVDNTSDATKNSAVATLTNKRITARIGTTASSATPSIDCDSYDQYNITALTEAITSVTVTGTPTDGQKLLIRIKDDGTGRAIAWGSSFVSSGVATLPTTTVASKTHLVGLLYDSAAAKWVCVAADGAGY